MTGDAASELVFDGDLLRARVWWPGPAATTLYVTFRQRTRDPGTFSDFRAVRQALALGSAHLHVQSRWNDWYLNAETAALEAALRRLRTCFDSARALGFSMGGYAALRFAGALALDQALVISPQFTLDHHTLPEDRRYAEAGGFDARLGDLRVHARSDLTGVVVFDPFRRLDRLHANLISATMPGMALAPFCFGGHPATLAVGEVGGFGAVQRLSLCAPLSAQELVRLHRDLRARSRRYWRDRAALCLKHGRSAAAEAALERFEALDGPDDPQAFSG